MGRGGIAVSSGFQLDRPPLLVDLIIGKLQEAIISGEIPPSTRLTEEKLSKQLNTSRTPLRESLMKLEHMGFVSRRSGGGWDVAPLNVDRMLERYDVKMMIELYAVLRSTEQTRCRFHEKITCVMQTMKEAVEKLDYDSYREQDFVFHGSLVELYDSDYLQGLYRDTVKHIHWVRKMAISPFIDIKDSFRDHGRIVAALGKGELHEAVQHLLGHLERLIQNVRRDLKTKQAPLPEAARLGEARQGAAAGGG
jgi:DNA-binding GntR family transcriptional regulator